MLLISRYLARICLLYLLAVLLVLGALVYIIDTVELLRRAEDAPEATLLRVMLMAACKLPHMLERILPFTTMFAAMFTLARLSKSQELVAARAAGVSVWQFMLPLLLVASLTGGVRIVALNPLAAHALAYYEQMEVTYLGKSPTALSSTRDGLWLRQQNAGGGYTLIHAASLLHTMELVGVTFTRFDKEGEFTERLDVKNANLREGYWQLGTGWLSRAGEKPQALSGYQLPTDTRMAELQNRFANPEILSFWALPRFIAVLEKSGFPALRHKMHWQSLLASPALFAALVLMSALFALGHNRKGNALRLLAGGIAVGLALFFISDVVAALGISGRLPIWLAAWSPAIVYTLLGCGLLLQQEDG